VGDGQALRLDHRGEFVPQEIREGGERGREDLLGMIEWDDIAMRQETDLALKVSLFRAFGDAFFVIYGGKVLR
jgi:hypothetical protein